MATGHQINNETVSTHLVPQKGRRVGIFVFDGMVGNGVVFKAVGVANHRASGAHATTGFVGMFFLETDDVDGAIGVVLQEDPVGTEDHGIRDAIRGTEVSSRA